MKRLVWGLIFLLSILSVSASFFPYAGVLFTIKETKCYPNGSIVVNITHEGKTVAFKDINLTIESDDLSSMQLKGTWYVNSNVLGPNDTYTGSDFVGKSKFNYRTSAIFTKGKYIVTALWPSGSIYEDKYEAAIICPGKVCASDDQCVAQQKCSNNVCEWLKCNQEQNAQGHTCLPKCNDYNPCTQDYYIDGQCVFVKVPGCVIENGVRETNILAIIWNWLKSRYE